MFNILKKILTAFQRFVDKNIPRLISLIEDLEEFLGLIPKRNKNKRADSDINKNEEPLLIATYVVTEDDSSDISEAILSEEVTSENETSYVSSFFNSQKEEDVYYSDLSLLLKKYKVRPELAYYMLCVDNKMPKSKIENEFQNLFKTSFAKDLFSIIAKNEKMKETIMPNNVLNEKKSLSLNKILREKLFTKDSSIVKAKYSFFFLGFFKN